VGAAPAHILEEVMQAVSEGKSETILKQVDHLISEGHSPTHFARQMVRFLRNATVAKIAGKDSALLQISGEERERVSRIAELFGEEDLTRHLQIMLRTHNELGYKQEQRFHLELGLLKMAHAQKLIPIEQLLSDVTGTPTHTVTKPAARPSIVGTPDTRRTEPPAARSSYVSPFAADSARKGTPRQEDEPGSTSAPGPRIVATSTQSEPVIMGSAAPAPMRESSSAGERREMTSVVPPSIPIQPVSAITENAGSNRSADTLTEATRTVQEASSPVAADLERLQACVLQALSDGNQRIFASMLAEGEWSVQGNELIVKVGESQTVVDMSFGPEAKKIAIASASGVMGKALRFKVIPGATVTPTEKKNGAPRVPSTGGRGRAEQDPVVRRMQEKFGAQIRTVIDYKDKR